MLTKVTNTKKKNISFFKEHCFENCLLNEYPTEKTFVCGESSDIAYNNETCIEWTLDKGCVSGLPFLETSSHANNCFL